MNFEDIDKALDIESKPVETEVVKKEKKPEIKKVHSQEEQIQKDYEYTRGETFTLLSKRVKKRYRWYSRTCTGIRFP